MAFTTSVEVDETFEVSCPRDQVFAIVADVPWSVSHFPKLNQLVDLGGNTYRWEMEKIGVDRYSFQTVYACKYTSNEEKGWVKWAPVKGEGNGQVSGKWTLKALDDDTTRVRLQTTAELDLPLPKLTKMVVAPIVTREFQGLIETYLDNLAETFEDPKRRKRRKTPKGFKAA